MENINFFNVTIIAFACLMFIFYEFVEVDKDLEIKRLKKIIKVKNNDIKELKNINNAIDKIIKDKIKELENEK